MRRDVFLDNDSGGLSVLAGARVPEMIADARENDSAFMESRGALLLELYGDDSMPVRVVADEPLTAEEEAQWLGRVRWTIDAPDGRILVAGGFDPDVLADWLEKDGPEADGYGVAVVKVPPGTWRADLYAHVGSMNGRQLLGDTPGAWFRRDHPDEPFPLWLVRVLRFSGEEDPGHAEEWKKPDERIRSGEITVDLETRGFVGFLLHLHKDETVPLSETPDGGWFSLDTGARTPDVCPTGLPSEVEDRELVSIARSILQEKAKEAPPPLATEPMRVFEGWPGEPLDALARPVELSVKLLIDAYLLSLLASDGAPAVEIRVEGAEGWTPAPPQHDWVALPHDGGFRAGPPPNFGGWAMLEALVMAGQHLQDLPDGARLELGTRDLGPDDAKVGRLWLAGTLHGGKWRITEASPRVEVATLEDALEFTNDMFLDDAVTVRDAEERAILTKMLEKLGFLLDGKPQWKGETLSLAKERERTKCMLAGPLFRHRYAAAWPMPEPDEDED